MRLQRRREQRRLKRLRRKRREGSSESSPLRSQHRKTQVLESYAIQSGLKDPSGGAYEQVIHFPKKFSFIEDADSAIGVINRVVDSLRRPSAQVVNIDQSGCRHIDYAAEALSTALALEAKRAFPLTFRGTFPEDDSLRKVIQAAGMPRYLGVTLPNVEEIEAFPLHRGSKRKESSGTSSMRDRTATDLTEYVHTCLGRYGYGLTHTGLHHLSSLVSEVIGNAEDHSGSRVWWVSGYLQQGEEYGDCHLAIFNFGRTLAESLKELPSEAKLRRNIEKLIERHASRGVFGIGGWEPDRLWALYALQQGVSRFNEDAHFVGDRGQGTVELIRFFQKLGDTEGPLSPQMTIVSGRTQFIFDGSYQMQAEATEDGASRAIIAFNSRNSVEEPPDSKAVRKLRHYFPGTLISLRFYFDSDYLQRIGGGSSD